MVPEVRPVTAEVTVADDVVEVVEVVVDAERRRVGVDADGFAGAEEIGLLQVGRQLQPHYLPVAQAAADGAV